MGWKHQLDIHICIYFICIFRYLNIHLLVSFHSIVGPLFFWKFGSERKSMVWVEWRKSDLWIQVFFIRSIGIVPVEPPSKDQCLDSVCVKFQISVPCLFRCFLFFLGGGMNFQTLGGFRCITTRSSFKIWLLQRIQFFIEAHFQPVSSTHNHNWTRFWRVVSQQLGASHYLHGLAHTHLHIWTMPHWSIWHGTMCIALQTLQLSWRKLGHSQNLTWKRIQTFANHMAVHIWSVRGCAGQMYWSACVKLELSSPTCRRSSWRQNRNRFGPTCTWLPSPSIACPRGKPTGQQKKQSRQDNWKIFVVSTLPETNISPETLRLVQTGFLLASWQMQTASFWSVSFWEWTYYTPLKTNTSHENSCLVQMIDSLLWQMVPFEDRHSLNFALGWIRKSSWIQGGPLPGTRWWFQTCFIFTLKWFNLTSTFFKWVETTYRLNSGVITPFLILCEYISVSVKISWIPPMHSSVSL